MVLTINIDNIEHPIIIERGLLKKKSPIFDLEGKSLIVTDSGVPTEYPESVQKNVPNSEIVTIPAGKSGKSIDNYEKLIRLSASYGLTRKDRIIAVGGSVVGDVAGFVAGTYMRGIDFINVPTTLLSQIDSSVGGKAAIDIDGIKDIAGVFHQPSFVVIDPDVLSTLDRRQFNAGIAEAIKAAVVGDASLFTLIEKSSDPVKDVEKIIKSSIAVKKRIVESDPKEKGLRKVLNFGHTLGHAYESAAKGALLRGEAVALGMLPMSSEHLRDRLLKIYSKYGLPFSLPECPEFSNETLLAYLKNDKKGSDSHIPCVYAEGICEYVFRSMTPSEIIALRS